MAETRKLAAILAADVAAYSKLTGSDEERTLARPRALRSDLIDPTIALHHGHVVKRTGVVSSLSSEVSSMVSFPSSTRRS
jgi:adenylate cyclase